MNTNNICECECREFTKSGNRFVLGHNQKGKHHSEETKKKMRENHKGMLGKHHSEEAKRKIRKALKGHVASKETKEKIKENHKGMLGKHHSKEARKKIREFRLGKRHSEEAKQKMRGQRPNAQGKNHPRWKGGASPYPHEFNEQLKEKIRKRDNRTCQICSKTEEQNGRKLDVHHIDYNKKNCNPKNLFTLCHTCNNKVEVKGDREAWKQIFRRRIRNIYK